MKELVNYVVTYSGIIVTSEEELRNLMEEDYYMSHSDELPADETGWWERALLNNVEVYNINTDEVLGNGFDLSDIMGWNL